MTIFSKFSVIVAILLLLFIAFTQRIMLDTSIDKGSIDKLIKFQHFFHNISFIKHSNSTTDTQKQNDIIEDMEASPQLSQPIIPTINLNTLQNTSQSSSDYQKVNHVPFFSKGRTRKPEQITFLDSKATPHKPDINHPEISPRQGTDISEANHHNLINCPHQSDCIIPELQLQKKYKIYFCKHPVRGGVRFYFLAREGFLLHPNVEFVEEKDINSADYIVYLPASAPWHKSECNHTEYTKKMIVLDEFDGPNLYEPLQTHQEMVQVYGQSKQWYYMYFKRSFVHRRNGIFHAYPHRRSVDVYPLTYPLAEAYIQDHFNQHRDIDIMCTLRGNKHMLTRQRVQDWIAEYVKENEITNAITGQLNTATRTSISTEYFEHLHNSRIIVTVNPADWEGDFRLWESMASGSLIFVDPLFVPHPHPMVHEQHIIYFDNHNKTDLWTKLDYYRYHQDIAKKIAFQGYLHAMKYHRTVNLADYILRSIHLKEMTILNNEEKNLTPPPKYTYTAQYLNHEAHRQEDLIRYHHKPGKYHHTHHMKNHTHIHEDFLTSLLHLWRNDIN